MTYRSEIAEIKRLSRQIERTEAELEAAKWERAERVAALVDEGHSRRKIAEDIGAHESAVATWVKIWHAYGSTRASRRPRYADADYEAARRGPFAPPRVERGAGAAPRSDLRGAPRPRGAEPALTPPPRADSLPSTL